MVRDVWKYFVAAIGQGAIRRIAVVALLLTGVAAGPAAAVPSFAVQTGLTCSACHVGGFGPQLTPVGRQFKLRGYTSRTKDFNLPFSAMAVASYIHTAQNQSGPPAPHFGVNDNVALDQASLFIAGGVGAHFGGFVQTTYNGIDRTFSWDNADLRAVTTLEGGGHNLLLGLSLNNSPGVQDVWNTLPAWGFPYTSSGLAPAPGAAPLMTGAFAQSVLGLTAYALLDDRVYLEAGAYDSLSPGLLRTLGSDPTASRIHGAAPYARAAYQFNSGAQNIEIGAFGLWASLYPGRDESTGTTDVYQDLGLDASYQLAAASGRYTANVRYTHERQALRATQLLGGAANVDNTLQDLRGDVSYYWKNKIGLTVGAFDTWGSADDMLFAGNRRFRPDSRGLTAQLDATPWGDGASPFGRRFNMRFGLQYTAYGQFEGATHNYDCLGHNASDNNTVRLFSWVAF